jgi:hypothetical protein
MPQWPSQVRLAARLRKHRGDGLHLPAEPGNGPHQLSVPRQPPDIDGTEPGGHPFEVVIIDARIWHAGIVSSSVALRLGQSLDRELGIAPQADTASRGRSSGTSAAPAFARSSSEAIAP